MLGRVLEDERAWRRAVWATVAAALAARLLIVAVTDGGSDLFNYSYFSAFVLEGINPYDPPAGGPVDPSHANHPPAEMLLFTGLLEVWNSPDALRLLFAASDAALIAVVGLAYPRRREWRAAFIAFYAFNPYVLQAWTATAQDKTFMFLLLALALLGIERGRLALSWAAAGVLAVLKWISVGFAAPLAHFSAGFMSRRRLALIVGLFLVALALSQLPWFPDSLEAYSRRDARTTIDPPIHASPTMLLSELGLYDPLVPKLFLPLGLLATYALYLRGTLDIRETAAASVLCWYVALPDHSFTRALMVTLPFVLVLEMTALRWMWLWAVSSVASVTVYTAVRGGPGALEAVFGENGTVQHVLWANSITVLVLVWLVRDVNGRLSLPHHLAPARPA